MKQCVKYEKIYVEQALAIGPNRADLIAELPRCKCRNEQRAKPTDIACHGGQRRGRAVGLPGDGTPPAATGRIDVGYRDAFFFGEGGKSGLSLFDFGFGCGFGCGSSTRNSESSHVRAARAAARPASSL